MSNLYRTVRFEDDEDGVWWLREHADTGERVYELAQRASDLHRNGYIYFKRRWVKRPSQSVSVENFIAEMFL